MREIKTLELTKEQLDEKYGKDAFILKGLYEDKNVYELKPKSTGLTGIPMIALEQDGIFEVHRDLKTLKALQFCTPIKSQ